MTKKRQFLGLDIGNAKVKLCWIADPQDLAAATLRWDSLPLPMSANRAQDFKQALPLQILRFLDQHDLGLQEMEATVVCCSHSLSFAQFADSIYHLASVLQGLFRDRPVFLLRADGQLTPLTAIAELSPAETIGYTFTNFYGSAFLGSRLIRNGLSLDLGTTTLDVIPIIEGQIDPQGLVANSSGQNKAQDYLRFRYQQGRIHWLGLTATSLSALAQRVPVGPAIFEIVPRQYKTDLLLALRQTLFSESERQLLEQHAYGRQFPDPLRARQQLAQFIGLDASLVSEAELQEIAAYLWEVWIDRLSQAIQQVARQNFKSIDTIEIASFALGEQLLLVPALQRAGFETDQIKTLHLRRDQALWSASSVFAMAVLAAEHGLQAPLALAEWGENSHAHMHK